MTSEMTGMDPITLAVVEGSFYSIVREMGITMSKTARSITFKVTHDYSCCIFDTKGQAVMQGEDEIPIHVGSTQMAAQSTVEFFGTDIFPGDVIYHNDPATGGNHLPDMTVFRPIFYKGKLVFWAACKAHMSDTGGFSPGGYQPLAEEIYHEGVRIPPVKIFEKGQERKDVFNLILAQLRYPAEEQADIKAKIAATSTAERRLVQLLDKYGESTIRNCVEQLQNIAERKMREFIASLPDGVYNGSSWLHDDGHGSGDIEIKVTVVVSGEELHIRFDTPKQLRSYYNCYPATTFACTLLGVLQSSPLQPPINAGSYRPIRLDCGPKGTLANAVLPAACSMSPMVGNNLISAIKVAMCQANPGRAHADWGHTQLTNVAGQDVQHGRSFEAFMSPSYMSGAGAVAGMDGWPTLGSAVAAGGCGSGNIEDFEYEYPLYFTRFEFRQDSGGAGKWKGGEGAICEFEGLGVPLSIVAAGVGDRFPSASMAGATSRLLEPKLGKRYIIDAEGTVSRVVPHSVIDLKPGERLRCCPPGGGGVGNPFERDQEVVRQDVLNALVSLDGAREDYGVIIDPETMVVDSRETKKKRAGGSR